MINIFLNNLIKKLTKSHERVKTFREYTDIQHVTILFDMEDLSVVQTFVETLKADGKDVTAFSFASKKSTNMQLPEHFQIWSRNQLDFWGIPKEPDFKKFKGQKSDTLIDLTKNSSSVLRYLLLHSCADFRVGFNHNNAKLYDFLIERNQEQDFSYFVNQMLFYMKSIRTK